MSKDSGFLCLVEFWSRQVGFSWSYLVKSVPQILDPLTRWMRGTTHFSCTPFGVFVLCLIMQASSRKMKRPSCLPPCFSLKFLLETHVEQIHHPCGCFLVETGILSLFLTQASFSFCNEPDSLTPNLSARDHPSHLVLIEGQRGPPVVVCPAVLESPFWRRRQCCFFCKIWH